MDTKYLETYFPRLFKVFLFIHPSTVDPSFRIYKTLIYGWLLVRIFHK